MAEDQKKNQPGSDSPQADKKAQSAADTQKTIVDLQKERASDADSDEEKREEGPYGVQEDGYEKE